MRRTKIVATVGPASDRPGVLDAMIAAGVDVARLNASHSSREELVRRLAEVRAAAGREGRHVAILVDLPGAKLRVGEVAPGTVLVEGAAFALLAEGGVGDAAGAVVSHARLSDDVAAGDRVLIDDGAIELRVCGVASGRVDTEVVTGGPLSSRKGVNVPGIRLSVEGVTALDEEIAQWAAGAGADWLAQSFVRSADDIRRLRAVVGEAVPICAKVEKHEAMDELDGIVAAADAVMVARGDLAVETSPEGVPVVQRHLVRMCRAAERPVIVATQMLESMRSAPRPTRAEASDVATAVFQLADAVMLSAESAVGDYPVQTVETMARIVGSAEEHLAATGGFGPGPAVVDGLTPAVAEAACDLAADLDAAAIVTATESGATARAVAARRPVTPVLAITPDAAAARRLALVWGIAPVVVGPYATLEDTAAEGLRVAREEGLAASGDEIVLTAGVAINRPGTTDMVRVLHA